MVGLKRQCLGRWTAGCLTSGPSLLTYSLNWIHMHKFYYPSYRMMWGFAKGVAG